ncbi:hypothetical protein TSUD_282060 [Trifolium subterraneum]|uniref:RNase H type-1 domain-containing protein n=1 Tax=Trifolium subterraneum TaxID=3900 RepID=A0A2Z6MV58_TRISU|nr:hypothetical protein TSUD_282060 [Trifolium subterraneum]
MKERYEIVNGVADVEGITNEVAVGEENKAAEGVPSFWLTALKNNRTLAEEITERDEEALKYLKDIKWCKLDKPYSFKLEFNFDSNPYFQNSVITKTYDIIEVDDSIVVKSTGTEIEWHPGKCLTHKFLKKPKKRSRNAKGIINTEKCESFFNFFNPPQIPEDDDDDDVEELQFLMECDYKIGSTIRGLIIPQVVSWFTGEADKWKSKSKSGSMSQPVPTKCSLHWKPPKLNFVKLNTDGACIDRKIAGCGGVIRGNQGEWLGGFAKKIGDCDAFTAELWGVLEGLCLVSRMGFANVEVSTDLQVVVEVLMNGRVQGFANYPLIRKIHNMINRDWNIEFMHEYREANKCADALARIGCSLKHKVTFFRECPDNVKEFLLADELGIVSPRLMAS